MAEWNSYIADHPVIADAQIPNVCFQFAAALAATSPSIEMRRCFTLHLLNLLDYALLTPDQVDRCHMRLELPVDTPLEPLGVRQGSRGFGAPLPRVSGSGDLGRMCADDAEAGQKRPASGTAQPGPGAKRPRVEGRPVQVSVEREAPGEGEGPLKRQRVERAPGVSGEGERDWGEEVGGADPPVSGIASPFSGRGRGEPCSLGGYAPPGRQLTGEPCSLGVHSEGDPSTLREQRGSVPGSGHSSGDFPGRENIEGNRIHHRVGLQKPQTPHVRGELTDALGRGESPPAHASQGPAGALGRGESQNGKVSHEPGGPQDRGESPNGQTGHEPGGPEGRGESPNGQTRHGPAGAQGRGQSPLVHVTQGGGGAQGRGESQDPQPSHRPAGAQGRGESQETMRWPSLETSPQLPEDKREETRDAINNRRPDSHPPVERHTDKEPRLSRDPRSRGPSPANCGNPRGPSPGSGCPPHGVPPLNGISTPGGYPVNGVSQAKPEAEPGHGVDLTGGRPPGVPRLAGTRPSGVPTLVGSGCPEVSALNRSRSPEVPPLTGGESRGVPVLNGNHPPGHSALNGTSQGRPEAKLAADVNHPANASDSPRLGVSTATPAHVGGSDDVHEDTVAEAVPPDMRRGLTVKAEPLSSKNSAETTSVGAEARTQNHACDCDGALPSRYAAPTKDCRIEDARRGATATPDSHRPVPRQGGALNTAMRSAQHRPARDIEVIVVSDSEDESDSDDDDDDDEEEEDGGGFCVQYTPPVASQCNASEPQPSSPMGHAGHARQSDGSNIHSSAGEPASQHVKTQAEGVVGPRNTGAEGGQSGAGLLAQGGCTDAATAGNGLAPRNRGGEAGRALAFPSAGVDGKGRENDGNGVPAPNRGGEAGPSSTPPSAQGSGVAREKGGNGMASQIIGRVAASLPLKPAALLQGKFRAISGMNGERPRLDGMKQGLFASRQSQSVASPSWSQFAGRKRAADPQIATADTARAVETPRTQPDSRTPPGASACTKPAANPMPALQHAGPARSPAHPSGAAGTTPPKAAVPPHCTM
jgi:hypothetical protein